MRIPSSEAEALASIRPSHHRLLIFGKVRRERRRGSKVDTGPMAEGGEWELECRFRRHRDRVFLAISAVCSVPIRAPPFYNRSFARSRSFVRSGSGMAPDRNAPLNSRTSDLYHPAIPSDARHPPSASTTTGRANQRIVIYHAIVLEIREESVLIAAWTIFPLVTDRSRGIFKFPLLAQVPSPISYHQAGALLFASHSEPEPLFTSRRKHFISATRCKLAFCRPCSGVEN